MPPFLLEWLQALGASSVAVFLRDSTVAYASLNAAHIFSIGLVIGSIATLDLRLLGVFRGIPLAALAPPLSRIATVGVVLAIGTGFLLFSVRPVAYASNPAFLAKISLVLLGVLNALLLRTNSNWRSARKGVALHGSVRASALASLVIWAGAVLAGRWIGFLQ